MHCSVMTRTRKILSDTWQQRWQNPKTSQQNKNNIFFFYEKFLFPLMESYKEFCNISENVHCGIAITDEYAGELVCQECGAVLEEKTPQYNQE